MRLANAAIKFEPDGYLLSGDKLMGRQAAGHGFLRAVVAANQLEPVWAYTPFRRSAEIFAHTVREMDPAADPRWLPADQLGLLGKVGTLYLPGPGLTAPARLRLRAGPAAFSICGVTHTIASHVAMDAIVEMLTAPVMPWDAVICTSQAAAKTVKLLIDGEVDYLRWRLGCCLKQTMPQLPIIPLGVHCSQFTFTDQERVAAREILGIHSDEVVALFMGRLSFHAKAHPHPMYIGLQAAAERTGKKVTLVQSGRFGNPSIETAFRDGASRACPDVRPIFTDGRNPEMWQRCWAAADFFVSLSDNFQETFGLTPIEAMAAGLPVVVTDWDGYKDTVRHGVEGFRIATWMPSSGLGEYLARRYEARVVDYDQYVGFTCQTVSLDLSALTEHLSDLISKPDLRRNLGAAGRRRAREVFDWTVVYRRYQELWGELEQIRQVAQSNPEHQSLLRTAPKVAPSRNDPFNSFGHYATTQIGPAIRVSVTSKVDISDYNRLANHPLFSYARGVMPKPELVDHVFRVVGSEKRPLTRVAKQTGFEVNELMLAVSILAKMGLVRLWKDELRAGE